MNLGPGVAEFRAMRERLAYYESFPPLPYASVTAPARQPPVVAPALVPSILPAVNPPPSLDLAATLQRLNEQLLANAQDTAAIRRHLNI
jgi:hypothetical protein